MQAASPIYKGRNKENGDQQGNLLSREHVLHDTVNGHRTEKRDEGIEDHVDIIVAKAEQVENSHDLYEEVRLYIIPPGIPAGEEVSVAAFITIVKEVSEKVDRVSS